MLKKIPSMFPNQAIPAVYGDSLSYTQQVAYLQAKINEIIDTVNETVLGGALPTVTAGDNGKIVEVIEGAWQLSTSLLEVLGRLNTLEGSLTGTQADVVVLQRQMASILDDIVQLTATLVQINQGDVEPDSDET